MVHSEASGKFRGIPDLAVTMGQHCPKTPERSGAYANAKLRQVSFKKRADEVLTPVVTF